MVPLALAAVVAQLSIAASPSWEIGALAGYPGVTTVIEAIPGNLQAAGVDEDDLQNQIDLALRSAHIMQSTDGPTLYVNINAAGEKSGPFGGSIEVEAYRPWSTGKGAADLVLWRHSYAFIASQDRIDGTIRDILARLLTAFCNDFLAAQEPTRASADLGFVPDSAKPGAAKHTP